MPYIPEEYRPRVDEFGPTTPGELNYYITRVVLDYVGPEPSYDDFNDVLGVLSAVGFELYRRRVAPYEDWKIDENGDVY